MKSLSDRCMDELTEAGGGSTEIAERLGEYAPVVAATLKKLFDRKRCQRKRLPGEGRRYFYFVGEKRASRTAARAKCGTSIAGPTYFGQMKW